MHKNIYVHISFFSISKLKKPNEAVLKGKSEIVILLDFPFCKRHNVHCPVQASMASELGITRGDIFLALQKKYREIYAEEEMTNKASPLERLLWEKENASSKMRMETDGSVSLVQAPCAEIFIAGKYGIWGFHMDQLVLKELKAEYSKEFRVWFE